MDVNEGCDTPLGDREQCIRTTEAEDPESRLGADLTKQQRCYTWASLSEPVKEGRGELS